MIRALLLTGVFVFALPAARAWDPLGHMLVARLAQNELTPDTRARMDAAIARFNQREKADAAYDFVTAACWMDDVRSRTKDFNAWHYVNLPFTREGTPIPTGSPAEPNVVWGIDYATALATGRSTDPAIDPDQALVILLHLVGDVHQPLHATSRGDDQGGNKVKIANLQNPLADLIFSKGGNLHFFWDSAYRRVYRDGKATVLYEAPLHDRFTPVAGHQAARDIVEREAAALQKKYPRSAMIAPQADAATWALESHGIGFNLAYGTLPSAPAGQPVRLTGSYVDASREAAEKRIALAAYRLADLLNRLLAPPTATNPTAPAANNPNSTSEPGSGTAE